MAALTATERQRVRQIIRNWETYREAAAQEYAVAAFRGDPFLRNFYEEFSKWDTGIRALKHALGEPE